MKAWAITVLVCLTALLINHEQCEVKALELRVQLEVAKALGKYTKPSFEIDPADHRKERL